MEITNPYFDEYTKLPDDLDFVIPGQRPGKLRFDRSTYKDNRSVMVSKYSWSVPTNEVIIALARKNPRIVEMGAGTGYWAWLLTQAGSNVVAYDRHPPSRRNMNNWRHNVTYHPVRKGNTKHLRLHEDRTLLLAWPPYCGKMAVDCLLNYKGNRIIYVGEHHGGCCATDQFFEMLMRDWVLDGEYDLPQWDGLHDGVWEYERL